MAKYFLIRLVLLFALSKHQQANAQRGKYTKYCRVSLPDVVDACVVNAMQAAYEGKLGDISVDECGNDDGQRRRNLRADNKQEEGRNLATYNCSNLCGNWGAPGSDDRDYCFRMYGCGRRQLESGEAASSPEDELDAIATHHQTRELGVACENYQQVVDAMNNAIEKSVKNNGAKKKKVEDALFDSSLTTFDAVEIWD